MFLLSSWSCLSQLFDFAQYVRQLGGCQRPTVALCPCGAMVGGTRKCRLDGIRFKPRKLPDCPKSVRTQRSCSPTTTPAWVATQTTCGASVAPALFAGDRVHALLGAVSTFAILYHVNPGVELSKRGATSSGTNKLQDITIQILDHEPLSPNPRCFLYVGINKGDILLL